MLGLNPEAFAKPNAHDQPFDPAGDHLRGERPIHLWPMWVDAAGKPFLGRARTDTFDYASRREIPDQFPPYPGFRANVHGIGLYMGPFVNDPAPNFGENITKTSGLGVAAPEWTAAAVASNDGTNFNIQTHLFTLAGAVSLAIFNFVGVEYWFLTAGGFTLVVRPESFPRAPVHVVIRSRTTGAFSTVEAFANGTPVGSIVAPVAVPISTGQQIVWGNIATRTKREVWNGVINLAGVFSFPWSDEQIEEWTFDPYILIRPEPSYYFPSIAPPVSIGCVAGTPLVRARVSAVPESARGRVSATSTSRGRVRGIPVVCGKELPMGSLVPTCSGEIPLDASAVFELAEVQDELDLDAPTPITTAVDVDVQIFDRDEDPDAELIVVSPLTLAQVGSTNRWRASVDATAANGFKLGQRLRLLYRFNGGPGLIGREEAFATVTRVAG